MDFLIEVIVAAHENRTYVFIEGLLVGALFIIAGDWWRRRGANKLENFYRRVFRHLAAPDDLPPGCVTEAYYLKHLTEITAQLYKYGGTVELTDEVGEVTGYISVPRDKRPMAWD